MLVIVSDLRLSDGSLGTPPSPAAFQHFARRLGEMASAASYRADGNYRAVEAINLLLLGDVLDLIRSSLWLECDGRPWHDPHSPDVFHIVARITERILERNSAALAVLRGMAAGAAVSVSLDPRSAGCADSSRRQPVPVRIHYLVGDRDWLVHLPGPHFDRLRSLVVAHLGLANAADSPFPHDPAESGSLLELLRQHRVIARHGDIFDPIHFEEDRNASSLGDAIAIELFARFRKELRAQLADRLPMHTLDGLAAFNKLRPVLFAPVWIEEALERTCPARAMQMDVKSLWDRLVDRFLQLNFVRSRSAWGPLDLVDSLAKVLKFSSCASARRVRAIADWIGASDESAGASYGRRALAEHDFRNGRAKHVVYGHAHSANLVSLESNYAEMRVDSPDAMTCLAFYQGDERGGRSYERAPDDFASGRVRFAA